jgi:hypothetical protein
MTTKAFAAHHGVNPHTLNGWIARFRRNTVVQRATFVEVEVQPEPVVATHRLMLRFEQRDLVIEVDSDIDPAQLARLVDTLC